MNTLDAWAMAQANRGNIGKVFDWHKAAELIKQHNIKNAQAGLAEDWLGTSGDILVNGEPILSDYTFLASTWATPILMDMDTFARHECYVMETDKDNPFRFNEDSKWAGDSLKILGKQIASINKTEVIDNEGNNGE